MLGFSDIQSILDRVLGEGQLPRHGAFWRGVSLAEFLTVRVHGMDKIVVAGEPESSNLVKALRGLAPFGRDLTPRPAGALLPRMPQGRQPASESDIVAIEEWIRNGCHEFSDQPWVPSVAMEANHDQNHIDYWRAVDLFFLPIPGHASAETAVHVGRMHFRAFQAWSGPVLQGAPESMWTDYLAQKDVSESFAYIRTHQRRLLEEFYANDESLIFDSLWKFGGNLLPDDPLRPNLPQHTMNGVDDWFFWAPQLDATLRAGDASSVDMILARAWQIGIVADGRLREDRPAEERMPIPDFSESGESLRIKVLETFEKANAAALLSNMRRRAVDRFSES